MQTDNSFREEAKEHVTKLLERVSQIIDINWEFNDQGLTVAGIEGKDLYTSFRHPNAARAYLDGILIGYDLGFGDGREDNLLSEPI